VGPWPDTHMPLVLIQARQATLQVAPWQGEGAYRRASSAWSACTGLTSSPFLPTARPMPHATWHTSPPHATFPQFGLVTVLLSVLMPLWGSVSFRSLGILQRFPERLQPLIKVGMRPAVLSAARMHVV
jgi:hypothetical protein